MHFRSWRAKGEKKELGLREDQGFDGRSSHLWFSSDQEEVVLKNQEIQR